jgi:hypothetical protein
MPVAKRSGGDEAGLALVDGEEAVGAGAVEWCLSQCLEKSTRGSPLDPVKGKRTKRKGLINVLGQTETNIAVPVVYVEPVAERGAHAPRSVAPRAAPHHTIPF